MILTFHGNRRVLCTSVKITSGSIRKVRIGRYRARSEICPANAGFGVFRVALQLMAKGSVSIEVVPIALLYDCIVVVRDGIGYNYDAMEMESWTWGMGGHALQNGRVWNGPE